MFGSLFYYYYYGYHHPSGLLGSFLSSFLLLTLPPCPSHCCLFLSVLPIPFSLSTSPPDVVIFLPVLTYTFLVRSNQPDRAPWPPFLHRHFTSGRVGTPITDAAFMRPLLCQAGRCIHGSLFLQQSHLLCSYIFLAFLIMLFSASTVNSIHRCVMIQELRRCPESNSQAETRDLLMVSPACASTGHQ